MFFFIIHHKQSVSFGVKKIKEGNLMKNIKLTTERLFLREVRKSDWKAVHEYAIDPIVCKFMPWGPNTEEDTKNYIKRAMNFRKEVPRTTFELAIILKSNQKRIGGCCIVISDVGNKQGWIGYCLNKNFWQQGYVTEAAVKLLEFGFEKLKLHRIFATCDTKNIGSARVLEKIGMRREGQMREHKLIRKKWRDSFLYAVINK